MTLEPYAAEWQTLGDASDNIFATWEWMSTWWRHFGRGRALHLEVVRDANGSVIAIAPLYEAARRPLRVLRFVGHGPSDQLGPVCAPAARTRAATALRTLLAGDAIDWDLLIADELPRDNAWSVLGGRILGRSASPTVRFGTPSWDEFVACWSRNRRSQLSRKERALARIGKVTYRRTRDPDELAADFSTFLALHAARWRDEGGSRAFVRREAFHRDFLTQAFARDRVRLRFLEVDGRPVAALYNLRLNGAESNYQAGRDPGLAALSVGTLLHMHAMRDALAEGASEYRFLRGAESYKLDFANADPGLVAVALTRGPVAGSIVPPLKVVPGLRRPLRRRVPAPYSWGTGSTPLWGEP